MPDRCRLCTTNDRDGLADELAEQMWVYASRATLDDRPFSEAGGHWQIVFRHYAQAFIDMMAPIHG